MGTIIILMVIVVTSMAHLMIIMVSSAPSVGMNNLNPFKSNHQTHIDTDIILKKRQNSANIVSMKKILTKKLVVGGKVAPSFWPDYIIKYYVEYQIVNITLNIKY